MHRGSRGSTICGRRSTSVPTTSCRRSRAGTATRARPPTGTAADTAPPGPTTVPAGLHRRDQALLCVLPRTHHAPECRGAGQHRVVPLPKPPLRSRPAASSCSPNPAAEGITCAVCHVRGDTILATTDSGMHDVVLTPELAGRFCADCHNSPCPSGPTATSPSPKFRCSPPLRSSSSRV